MGWGASGIDPAGKADVKGAYAPAVREVRRVQAASPGLPLFSLPVSLQFSYAADLSWSTVMAAVRQLFARCEGAV